MATVAEQLTALKAARATGALTVKTGDDLVTYRSLKEIDAIISDLESQVATGRRSRIRYLYQSGKGL